MSIASLDGTAIAKALARTLPSIEEIKRRSDATAHLLSLLPSRTHMKPTIGAVVTYQGLPAIVTALGDGGVCTVIPLAGGDHGCQHFGVVPDQLSLPAGSKPAPVAPVVRKAAAKPEAKPAKKLK